MLPSAVLLYTSLALSAESHEQETPAPPVTAGSLKFLSSREQTEKNMAGKRQPRKPFARRAGTKGFRAPEILVRSQSQTMKIDVWSAGVILLSILTQRYPFFQPHDDMEALQELRLLFGDRLVQATAQKVHGKRNACD
jgi:serine/threonine protein kinase